MALLLDGQPERSREDLDAELEARRDRDDLAAEEFRRFAEVLRARINGAL